MSVQEVLLFLFSKNTLRMRRSLVILEHLLRSGLLFSYFPHIEHGPQRCLRILSCQIDEDSPGLSLKLDDIRHMLRMVRMGSGIVLQNAVLVEYP